MLVRRDDQDLAGGAGLGDEGLPLPVEGGVLPVPAGLGVGEAVLVKGGGLAAGELEGERPVERFERVQVGPSGELVDQLLVLTRVDRSRSFAALILKYYRESCNSRHRAERATNCRPVISTAPSRTASARLPSETS